MTAFDPLATTYDLFVNWESRLPKEIEFLDDVLSRAGVRTLLDAACGTGMHLLALREKGYEVAACG